MQILFCTTESAPFSKVGGLADVSQALPAALTGLGAEVTVITPLYGSINRRDLPDSLKIIAQGTVSLGEYRERSFKILSAAVGSVTIWFVESAEYFARSGIYEDEHGFPFWDNGERYIFFQKVILAMVRRTHFHILHVNDHHTALLPVYLKTEAVKNPPKTVLTIHNIGYQGRYSPDILNLTGLGWAAFYPGGPLEFHGQTNFLKGGIIHADRVTTVSPSYASELLASPEISFGLDGVLRSLKMPLQGILNGVDYQVWSPEQDPLIPAHFSAENTAGKQTNRAALLARSGLPDLPGHALVGIISRLVDSKGFELLIPLEEELMTMPLQWTILGSGETRFEDLFRQWAERYPEKVAYHQGYDAALSHLIEAGADMFLMPSKYEACGLNQIYSLRYGTIPIVRQTGGLADTVQAWNGACGTGFNFQFYSPFALLQAINQALQVFRDKPAWHTLMHNAMSQDFSWERSARAYMEIYQELMK
ncbi:MAG: glycogen synthase [Candidatus Marinimicrobia bacterium]|nr:glycogen synthase [Candidatus Neomarinimicrobiota bacterium]